MTSFPNPLVLDFHDIDAGSVSRVGGKAANLGVLTRAGFSVPPGVCITTDAYRVVAQTAGLEPVLERLSSTSTNDTAELAALARDARAAILAASLPDGVTCAVAGAYSRMGQSLPVAVRSSATAEDLPFASFAGQQDSFLNVVGADAVLEAVRRCWASLWTERAVIYRATNGIDHRAVSLAVVLQRMVDAAVAGVLFTANSVTGRRKQAALDASPGLGEAIVSGGVNPDHFVVDTATGEILERKIGDKDLLIRARTGGGTEHVERADSSVEPCLSDDQIRALATLGDRVEAHYGTPQDIEWAIDPAGRIWLTQARPITSLFPLPLNAPPPGNGLRVYFCFSVAQGLTRPITPMGLAAFRLVASAISEIFGFPVSDPLSGPNRYAEAGQRLFIDLTGVLRSRVGRALMPRVLDIMETRSAAILRQLRDEPRLSLVTKSPFSFVRRLVRIVARYNVAGIALRALIHPESARRHAEQIGAGLKQRLIVDKTATSTGRLDFVQRVLLDDCAALVPRIMPAAGVGMAMLALAGRLLGDDAEPDDVQTVARALPHNVTTEMDLELWDLATQIRHDREAAAIFRKASLETLATRFRDGDLPAVLQRGLSEFLSRYGHRAVAEIDLGVPRWSDDPLHILGVLGNYLRLEDDSRAPDAVFARGVEEARAMIETLAARSGRKSRLRAWLVRFALERARALAGLRELPKFYVILVFDAVRRELMKVGADLTAQGRLKNAEDIFFLDLVEARAGLEGRDLRPIVTGRREDYERELRRRHVPRILLSDGTEPEVLTDSAILPAGTLAGTPASAGRVSGPARVIVNPVGAALQPGEILVAPSTDPGWTPLFLTASGLVMEMGGANSHGAVVAREYGIPAVVGVRDATCRIVNGQRISVDGRSGRVSLV